jgi:hypothetical protein
MKNPKGWRVEVSWRDSTLDPHGWTRIRDAKRARGTDCTAVGLLLRDDERFVVVALAVHGNEVAGVLTIPRGQVRKVRRLRR